jgi:transposase
VKKNPCLHIIKFIASKDMNRYKENIKMMDFSGKLNYRWEMINYAKREGISKAARVYNTTRKTVRKWIKRYSEGGIEALKNKSRKEQYFPNKMPEAERQQIINLRGEYPFWGARKIKEHLELTYSQVVINKKLKQAGLIKKKKRRYKDRKEREEYMKKIRNSYKPFQKIQVDIKYLTDIPELIGNLRYYKLPKYQITARDYKTGFQYIGFSYEKTSTATGIYIDYLCQQLEKIGVDLTNVTFQTDNGTEFVSSSKTKLSMFEKIITKKYKAKLKRIPPARPTYNSDVETVHNLIENEFYKVETFNSKQDMILKTFAYLIYFNNFRKNRNREGKTPKDIFMSEKKKTWKNNWNFKPIIVDDYMKDIQKIISPGYFYRLPVI